MGISIMENTITNLDIVYMNRSEGLIEKENKHINRAKKYIEYRITNICRDKSVECIEIIDSDKSQVEIIFSGLQLDNIHRVKRIKLKGLDENANYINIETKGLFSGSALMKYGVNIMMLCGDSYCRVNLKREDALVNS